MVGWSSIFGGFYQPNFLHPPSQTGAESKRPQYHEAINLTRITARRLFGIYTFEILEKSSVRKTCSQWSPRNGAHWCRLLDFNCQIDISLGATVDSDPDRLLLVFSREKISPNCLWEAPFICKQAQSDSRTGGSLSKGDSGFNFRQPTGPATGRNRTFDRKIVDQIDI